MGAHRYACGRALLTDLLTLKVQSIIFIKPAAMAALGQKRKSSVSLGMSAVGGKADFDFGWRDVCF